MDFTSSSIHQRLRALDERKKSRQKILDDLRAGKYDGIVNGADFFKQKDSAPPRQDRLLDAMPDLQVLRGERGQTLFRSFAIPRGTQHERGYQIPHPHCGASVHPVSSDILHHISRDVVKGEELRAEDLCFLDTETTGLMGGTGTVPFLVGVGWWEQSGDEWHFRLEQYLIEDFCHEGDMLERLTARLAQFRAVCTYNGKTFDIPVLRARGIMHRIPPARFRLKHIDLLHLSRRFWKRRLESVSLKNVEREILRIDRGPDVDGALIPSIFFHFARTGRADRLPVVLDHNAQDIVTLGALLSHLAEIVRDPLQANLLNHPEEFAAAARWFISTRQLDLAALAFKKALEGNTNQDRENELLGNLAALHKKRRAWPEAVEILEHLRLRPIAQGLNAWVDLAKYHEHVGKDAPKALALVLQCRKQLELECELSALRSREDAPGAASFNAALCDLEKRETRLRAKIERTAAKKKP